MSEGKYNVQNTNFNRQVNLIDVIEDDISINYFQSL